jgi:ankyrin repeat protein
LVAPLHWAALFENVDVVRALIDELHVPADIRDQNGRTALYWANSKDGELIDVLIKRGAAVNVRDNLGYTPLEYVTFFTEKMAVAQALLKYGANLNAKNVYGRTPLDYARKYNNEALIKLLEDAEQKQAAEIKFSKEQQAQEMAAMQAAEIVQTQQVQNDTVGGWYTTAPVHEDGYVVKGSTQEMKEVDSPLPEEVLKSFVMIDASNGVEGQL